MAEENQNSSRRRDFRRNIFQNKGRFQFRYNVHRQYNHRGQSNYRLKRTHFSDRNQNYSSEDQKNFQNQKYRNFNFNNRGRWFKSRGQFFTPRRPFNQRKDYYHQNQKEEKLPDNQDEKEELPDNQVEKSGYEILDEDNQEDIIDPEAQLISDNESEEEEAKPEIRKKNKKEDKIPKDKKSSPKFRKPPSYNEGGQPFKHFYKKKTFDRKTYLQRNNKNFPHPKLNFNIGPKRYRKKVFI